jgi:hypothetical protein
MVLQMQATAFINRAPLPSWRAVVPALVEWYLWVPLTPLILGLAARFPIRRPPAPAALAVHASGVVVASFLRGICYAAAAILVAGTHPAEEALEYIVRVSLGWLPVAAVVYGAVLAAGIGLEYARRTREAEIARARLEARLAQAELESLRAHLNPHFLFNALHTVSGLVRLKDPARAVDAIATLSDLLRDVLRRPVPEETTLEEELAFLQRYIRLAKLRFQDQLDIQWWIDREASPALVPRLLLQPLIENALTHGMGNGEDVSHVLVRASRTSSELEITVTDDGPGLMDAGRELVPESFGLGLAVTRARLRKLHGDGATLALVPGSPRGITARITLPFRLLSPSLSESHSTPAFADG